MRELRTTFSGFAFRFRLRTIRNRRVRNGRTRGRYVSDYVYIEVTDSSGHKREIYVGRYDDQALPRFSTRVKGAAPATSSSSSSIAGGGGKTGGYGSEISDAEVSFRGKRK